MSGRPAASTSSSSPRRPAASPSATTCRCWESISRPASTSCALYIFPTKVLTQDQFKSTYGWVELVHLMVLWFWNELEEEPISIIFSGRFDEPLVRTAPPPCVAVTDRGIERERGKPAREMPLQVPQTDAGHGRLHSPRYLQSSIGAAPGGAYSFLMLVDLESSTDDPCPSKCRTKHRGGVDRLWVCDVYCSDASYPLSHIEYK
jgi:hypothetical protein